jgi:hypothetical protein
MYNRHIPGSLGLKATSQTFLLQWNLLDWTPPLNGHLLTLNNLWRTLNVGIPKMIFGVSLFDWTPTYIEQYGRYTGVFNVSMVHCICAPEFGCGHAIPTPQTDDSNHWMGLLRNRQVLYIYIYISAVGNHDEFMFHNRSWSDAKVARLFQNAQLLFASGNNERVV